MQIESTQPPLSQNCAVASCRMMQQPPCSIRFRICKRRQQEILTKTFDFHVATASFREIYKRRHKFIVNSSRIKSFLFPGRWIGAVRFPGRVGGAPPSFVLLRWPCDKIVQLVLFFSFVRLGRHPWRSESERGTLLIGHTTFVTKFRSPRHVLTCLQQEICHPSTLIIFKFYRGKGAFLFLILVGVNNNPVWTWLEVEFSRS